MSSEWAFVAAVFVFPALVLIGTMNGPTKAYAHLRKYPGITKGILLALVAGVLFALGAQKANAGTWVEYTEMFLGLDRTFGVSPQCVNDGGPDPKTTSNMGFRQHIYKSDDTLYNVNLKYTHHSCAFNTDRYSYDAIGVELNYKINW